MKHFSQARRVFALLILAASVTFAQFESATVLGTVTDPSGKAVSGASVTLTNVRTGVSSKSKTDSSGNYLFVNQRLASYRVRVEMAGFKASDTESFDLAVDARQRVDLRLEIGSVSDSVTVTDAAGLLEADNMRDIARLKPTKTDAQMLRFSTI